MPRGRSSATVVPFEAAHARAAAALVVAGVRRIRATVPVLPGSWAEVATVERLTLALARRGHGVALLKGGRLTAFQAATLLDGHGGRWAYTPDVGHGATVRDPAAVDDAATRCYAALADDWVREACVEHVVTILADDAPTIATFGRLGFAPHVVDLVRDLSPIQSPRLPRGVTIRRAYPADAAAVLDLQAGLVRHLRAAPVFLRIPNAPALELQRRRIADQVGATLLAFDGDRAIAFLRIGPSADDVATIVRDRGTASITAAFTDPDRRGSGVGTALLGAALAWAREGRYARVAVDHEAANGEAARFWARHATPVAISLARRLPPATVPGLAS